jgi:hypothetical protein
MYILIICIWQSDELYIIQASWNTEKISNKRYSGNNMYDNVIIYILTIIIIIIYIYVYMFSFDMTIGIVKSILCYFYINTYYQHITLYQQIIVFNKIPYYKFLIWWIYIWWLHYIYNIYKSISELFKWVYI